jgi:hypothetical protein
MSTLKTTTAHRSATLITAAVILAALSLLGLALPLLAPATGGPPLVIVIAAVVLGIVGLAAAAGLWWGKHWAAWVAVIVSILNGLSAAPGLAAAPNPGLFISSVVVVVGSALIIVLALLPSSRRAYS